MPHYNDATSTRLSLADPNRIRVPDRKFVADPMLAQPAFITPPRGLDLQSIYLLPFL